MGPDGGRGLERTYNADVYVFCVQTATTHDTYDPLDVDQWRFYVLTRQTVESTGYRSLSLRAIEVLTDATPYAKLGEKISMTVLQGRQPTRAP